MEPLQRLPGSWGSQAGRYCSRELLCMPPPCVTQPFARGLLPSLSCHPLAVASLYREHRLRHQLKLAGNHRLNQLAEPLLKPGALEGFFEGITVRPSVLHGAPTGDQWLPAYSCSAAACIHSAAGTHYESLAASLPCCCGAPSTAPPSTPPAGDLWSGNIAAVEGQPAIFDPATYYGHHEAEWGMSWCVGSLARACCTAWPALRRKLVLSRLPSSYPWG